MECKHYKHLTYSTDFGYNIISHNACIVIINVMYTNQFSKHHCRIWCLFQCQAIVVGLMSAVVAVVMVGVTQQEFSLSHTLLLCSCSLITSSIASLVL